MVAEILAGLALAKSAVSGIKSMIDTANDVSDIAIILTIFLKVVIKLKEISTKIKTKNLKVNCVLCSIEQ